MRKKKLYKKIIKSINKTLQYSLIRIIVIKFKHFKYLMFYY